MSDRRPTLYLTKIGSPDQYGPGRDVGRRTLDLADLHPRPLGACGGRRG